MNIRIVTILLVVTSSGLLVSFQDCQQSRGNTDIFGPLAIRCDGTAREITYTNNTTVIVRLIAICSGATIEYQNNGGEWQQLRDWVPGEGAQPIATEVGAGYAVTVPRNRNLRLTCGRTESATDSCRFVLVNATRQPTAAQRIVDTTLVDCNTWRPSKFFNFSTLPIRVRVEWVDVCKDPDPPGQRANRPTLQVRVMGQNAVGSTPAPGPVNLSGTTASWNGTVPANNALELQCPGSIPGCRYLLSFVRN